ncbi:recombination regulator RecX [Nonomuraea sp. B12E4]|uniref:recombination regulator RecX n=1 Tax=Nonomuraea sp. B12E4 TaxID=3153564 RepID=UPI00325CE984
MADADRPQAPHPHSRGAWPADPTPSTTPPGDHNTTPPTTSPGGREASPSAASPRDVAGSPPATSSRGRDLARSAADGWPSVEEWREQRTRLRASDTPPADQGHPQGQPDTTAAGSQDIGQTGRDDVTSATDETPATRPNGGYGGEGWHSEVLAGSSWFSAEEADGDRQRTGSGRKSGQSDKRSGRSRRSERSGGPHRSEQPEQPGRWAWSGSSERSGQPERFGQSARSGRPEQSDQSEPPSRSAWSKPPDQHERPGQSDRPGYSAWPEPLGQSEPPGQSDRSRRSAWSESPGQSEPPGQPAWSEPLGQADASEQPPWFEPSEESGRTGRSRRSGRWGQSGQAGRPGRGRPGKGARGRGWLPEGPDADSSAGGGPEADPESVARAICLRLLTMAPKTRAQLAEALRKRDVPDEAADAVLSRFSELGLINDEAFAEAWVDSRHHGRGLAKRALAAELRHRGVDTDTVNEAVERLDADQEAETARRLVDRKLASTRSLDPQTRTRRLAGMLARKGYSSGLAFRVIREALEEEGIELEEEFP